MSSLRAGELVTPTVKLERQLGEGGMGTVWVAEHTTLHAKVVVKFIGDAIAADPDSVARFSREAAAAAAVRSPHVVQMHDHGVMPDGTPFIVMEYLEGRDLASYLQERGVLPIAEVDVIVSHACKALARAHEAGIVHRDIKPQNLFLCDVGAGEIFVKLLDFGVAKKGDALSTTKTGSSVGTPYYMSPEQVVSDKTVGPRADLWALGVVAFEALTGRKPFDGPSVGALALAICHGPLPVPSSVRPEIDRAFDNWFAKACARDPAGRFASAREMADVLHLCLSRAEVGLASTIDSQRGARREVSVPALPALPDGVTTAAPVSGGASQRERRKPGVRTLAILGAVALVVTVLFMMRSRAAAPTTEPAPTSPIVSGAVASVSAPTVAPSVIESVVASPAPSTSSVPIRSRPHAVATARETKSVPSSSASSHHALPPIE
jgi:serine/threonine protein kinase